MGLNGWVGWFVLYVFVVSCKSAKVEFGARFMSMNNVLILMAKRWNSVVGGNENERGKVSLRKWEKVSEQEEERQQHNNTTTTTTTRTSKRAHTVSADVLGWNISASGNSSGTALIFYFIRLCFSKICFVETHMISSGKRLCGT